MGDTREIADSVTTSSPKPTPGSQVAEILRQHPSKPPPDTASALLRAAVSFTAPADAATDAYEMPDDSDALAPARGIVMGLALVLPFWGAVGLAIHAILR